MVNLLLYSFEVSLITYVYSVILTEPGMLLTGLWKWLESKHLPEWIFNPLINCFKCVAGQVALWSFFFLFPYNIFNHIFFISLTIFISLIINKLYQWLTN